MSASSSHVGHAARAHAGSRIRRAIIVVCVGALGWVAWRLYASPYGPCLHCPGAIPTFALTLTAVYVGLGTLYLLLPGGEIRARGVNLLVSTATLFVVFALLELPVALGWLDYRTLIAPRHDALFEVRPWMNPQNLLDPELLHRHRPHTQFIGTSLGDLVAWYGIPTQHRYPVDVRYDRNGFRNLTDLDAADIAVIGDSFVEAPMTAQDQLLTSELQRRLGQSVVNLGQAGYGPQQELFVLRRFALPLRPRLILWLYFEGNDLEDFERYERTRRQWDQHEREIDGFSQRSFTRNTLLAIASRLPRPRSELWRKRGCPLRQPHNGAPLSLYFAYGNTRHLSAHSALRDTTTLDGATATIGAAARAVAAAGARFALVYVPVKLRVYQSLCDCGADSDIAQWQLADLPAYFQRWAQEQGVTFLDLTPALRRAAEAGDLVFYPDDDHWNARGQQIAAEAIVAMLSDTPAP